MTFATPRPGTRLRWRRLRSACSAPPPPPPPLRGLLALCAYAGAAPFKRLTTPHRTPPFLPPLCARRFFSWLDEAEEEDEEDEEEEEMEGIEKPQNRKNRLG